jgi:hypothetical protein
LRLSSPPELPSLREIMKDARVERDRFAEL